MLSNESLWHQLANVVDQVQAVQVDLDGNALRLVFAMIPKCLANKEDQDQTDKDKDINLNRFYTTFKIHVFNIILIFSYFYGIERDPTRFKYMKTQTCDELSRSLTSQIRS